MTLMSTLVLVVAWASHFKVLHRVFFILWARHCQASYSVLGQVLSDTFVISRGDTFDSKHTGQTQCSAEFLLQ